MAAKSGTAITAVEPTAPDEAFAADVAKPGDVDKIKAKQQETKSGKYGSTKAPAFKPPEDVTESENTPDEDEEEKSWIEIELLDEEGNPAPGKKYAIELPDGSLAKGTLDSNGVARIEGVKSGNCKVNFPELDKESWD
jgi:hypothetical protein